MKAKVLGGKPRIQVQPVMAGRFHTDFELGKVSVDGSELFQKYIKTINSIGKPERFTNELAVTANDSSLMSFFSDINTDLS